MLTAAPPRPPVAVAPEPPPARRPLVPNSVAGTMMFVFTEAMLFAGLISAHMVFVSNQVGELWPPPNQPLLPFAETARNSAALLLSGVTLALAWRAWRRGGGLALMGASTLLGALFVTSQGAEWVGLVREGLTLTSSPYGAFFYLIVGAHALHALGGILCLAWAWTRLRAGRLTGPQFVSVQIFWYFVVLVWPLIFLQVYR